MINFILSLFYSVIYGFICGGIVGLILTLFGLFTYRIYLWSNIFENRVNSTTFVLIKVFIVSGFVCGVPMIFKCLQDIYS